MANAGGKASNDIYTVFTAIALFIVAGVLAFVIYTSNELLGTPFPGITN